MTETIIQLICNETIKHANATISTHETAFTIKKKRSRMHNGKMSQRKKCGSLKNFY